MGIDPAAVTGTYEYPAEVVLERAAQSRALTEENARLRDHIDTDHAVMVALGRIAEAAVTMLEHVSMDTEEDREFHARAVGALRGQLGKMAATMKEANEMACEEVPGDRT